VTENGSDEMSEHQDAWAKLTPEEKEKQLNRVKKNLMAMGLVELVNLIRA
jgi:hypothetical protein